jgi:hypothetical protein
MHSLSGHGSHQDYAYRLSDSSRPSDPAPVSDLPHLPIFRCDQEKQAASLEQVIAHHKTKHDSVRTELDNTRSRILDNLCAAADSAQRLLDIASLMKTLGCNPGFCDTQISHCTQLYERISH